MSSARAEALLGWYAASARDLPWRRTRDPYAIWISEIMLQQTQVATVLPRFEVWLHRFPDVASLAKAPMDDVMKAWEGMGYYRRARLLHAAARLIVERHGGVFPNAFEAILGLPGIGRTTAGAIASIAFGERRAVLDGNVKRVLRRWHAQEQVEPARLWAWAESALAPARDAGAWNQAMMDLGAGPCRAVQPACGGCPVSAYCEAAFGEGRLPAARRKCWNAYWTVHVHLCPDRGLWVERRPGQGIWAGLWSPPITELEQAPGGQPAYVHRLTHRRLHLYPDLRAAEPGGDGRWVRVGELDGLALPTGIRRLLDTLMVRPPT